MKRTLLFVDDSVVVRNMVHSILRDTYDLELACDGNEALTKLEALEKDKKTVSLILTDINMPLMDGVELIKEVKKTQSYRFTPIIILTSEEQNPFNYKVVFNAWINKPFSQDELLRTINKVLNPLEYMKDKYSTT
jgi:two-component system chemotaxis response regulator CheY